MRDDVRALIENRPSWRLMQDQYLKDLLAARDIALSEKDTETLTVLDQMIAERKHTILNGLDPKMFSISHSAT